eukprot:m.42699 g.42699  ORF g.42699 m.42699 type:complete len:298 (-) comp10527_c0_seq5:189-1082(-)
MDLMTSSSLFVLDCLCIFLLHLSTYRVCVPIKSQLSSAEMPFDAVLKWMLRVYGWRDSLMVFERHLWVCFNQPFYVYDFLFVRSCNCLILFEQGIALVAHMELQLALYVFRCLVYARAIVLTDPMLLCNVRTTTSKLKDLMRDANMQSECKDFVCRNNTVVSIEDIVRLYSQFSPSKKLTPHTFATASKNSEILDDIHLRRFFQYGSLRGILHCTRTYPVLVDEREGCDDGDKDNEENTSGTRHINDSIDNCFISPDIAKLCTGEFSLEEISAIRRQSREHLRMKLYADKRIHLLNA